MSDTPSWSPSDTKTLTTSNLNDFTDVWAQELRRGGEVKLWAGVDIADFPVLTVTLEPDDGDPASSGQVVLRGEIGETP
jgi:hypothetical protein